MAVSEELLIRLVDAHGAAMFRFALGLTADSAHAADLTQQTFYAFAQQGRRTRDPALARRELFTRLYREIAQFLRKRQPEEPPENPDPEERAGNAIDHGGIAVDINSTSLLAALQELEPSFRAAVILFHLPHLTCRDIAGILNIPLGTVISRIHRGKAQLRAAFTRRREASTAAPDLLLRHAQ